MTRLRVIIMDDLSNAETALLGLLSEGPMYPYQIEREVRGREMRFWTELSMSSIYKVLRRLEKDGLVTRENVVSEGNRLRKLYTVTARGKQALEQKIVRLLSVPEHIRWAIDNGTYNCDLVPPNDVQAALAAYRAALEEKIHCYEELEGFLRSSGCPAHRLAIAIRPVFLLKAEAAWVDAYRAALSDPPAPSHTGPHNGSRSPSTPED